MVNTQVNPDAKPKGPGRWPDGAKSKKGKPSWNQGNYLTMDGKSDDLRYRWVLDDNQEIRKRLQQGFSFVNPETGIPGKRTFEGQAEDPLTATPTVRELVAMALPLETAEAHDEWVTEQTKKYTEGVVVGQTQERFDNGLGASAPIYGQTRIE